jgi:hypothetical protein
MAPLPLVSEKPKLPPGKEIVQLLSRCIAWTCESLSFQFVMLMELAELRTIAFVAKACIHVRGNRYLVSKKMTLVFLVKSHKLCELLETQKQKGHGMDGIKKKLQSIAPSTRYKNCLWKP